MYRTTKRFEKERKKLPYNIQEDIDEALAAFAKNRWDETLNYKRPRKNRNLCTIRVNYKFRIIGIVDGDLSAGNVVFYSVCSHDVCDKIISRL